MAKQSKKSPVKPCPFCGNIPEVNTKYWAHHESQKDPIEIVEQRVVITCKKCFCRKDIVNTAYMLPGEDEKAYRKCAKYLAKETIELMWNKRVNNGKL